MNRAVFLDRDGTLVREKGFVCRFTDVEVYPFAVETIRLLNRLDFRTVIVTNQSAVARGICSEQEVRDLHEALRLHFRQEGAIIDAFYFCPFLEEAAVPRYRRRHPHRKPSPGMLLQASRDLGIDLGASWMIGDSAKDFEAGIAAGCRTILVRTGKGKLTEVDLAAGGLRPDRIEGNILEAAKAIGRISHTEHP